jgi:hypothetical protein
MSVLITNFQLKLEGREAKVYDAEIEWQCVYPRCLPSEKPTETRASLRVIHD